MSECKFYTATTEKISCFCESELPWAGGPGKRFEQTQIKTKEPAIPENHLLHGTSVAMYIVGQERRLVNPPSQVVAGVRTVTTNMDGRDALPRMSRPFALSKAYRFHSIYSRRCWTTNVNLPTVDFINQRETKARIDLAMRVEKLANLELRSNKTAGVVTG